MRPKGGPFRLLPMRPAGVRPSNSSISDSDHESNYEAPVSSAAVKIIGGLSLSLGIRAKKTLAFANKCRCILHCWRE